MGSELLIKGNQTWKRACTNGIRIIDKKGIKHGIEI